MIAVKTHEDHPIIEVEVGESLTAEDYEHFSPKLEQKIEQSGKVNLFCRMDRVPDMSSGAIVRDFKLFFKHYSSFNKMAIISDDEDVSSLMKAEEILPGVNIECFDTQHEEQAWEWLKE